ncbi:MAG: hypothetical protein NZ958_03155 [Bacteroidia bacterium]|nr:hypothetical protein [Bacteroidia bacterium]MDW8088221.1 hypothetical protein [Bacteroidia bacterium]
MPRYLWLRDIWQNLSAARGASASEVAEEAFNQPARLKAEEEQVIW